MRMLIAGIATAVVVASTATVSANSFYFKDSTYIDNTSQLNTTYADRLARRGIIVDRTSTPELYRIPDPVLRQEVVGMAAKMRGFYMPPEYRCKGYFSDLTTYIPNPWVCRAAEISSEYNIVTRQVNVDGTKRQFQPERNVTRSEALAMLMAGVCMRPTTDGGVDLVVRNGESFSSDAQGWQKRVIARYYNDVNKIAGSVVGFQPNREATRGEVFEMAAQVLAYTDENGRGTECNFGTETLDFLLGELKKLPTFATIETFEDFIAIVQGHPDFRKVEDMNAFLDYINDYSLFNGVYTPFEFVTTIQGFEEFESAENMDEFVAILEGFDQLIDGLEGVPFLDNTSVNSILADFQKYPDFKRIRNFQDLLDKLRDHALFANVTGPVDLLTTINAYPELAAASDIVTFMGIVEDFDAFISDISRYPKFVAVRNMDDFLNSLSQEVLFEGYTGSFYAFFDRLTSYVKWSDGNPWTITSFEQMLDANFQEAFHTWVVQSEQNGNSTAANQSDDDSGNE